MLLLLLACTDPAPAPDAPVTPSPWGWEEVAERPAPYGLAEVEAALEEVVRRAFTIDPRDPYDVNEALIAEGDGTCPEEGVHNGLNFVTGDCVAASGQGYYGFVQYNRLEDFYFNGGAWNNEFRWITGTFRVLSTNGGDFAAQGEIEYHDYLDDTQRQAWTAHTWGEFHWTGPDATGGWLTEDLSLALDVEATTAGAPEDDGRQVSLDGAIARLGGAFDAVDFDGFAVPGATCREEPDGAVWLHDDQGLWYTVRWDTSCDGCATVTVDEGAPTVATLGTICPDLSTLASWGADPWSR